MLTRSRSPASASSSRRRQAGEHAALDRAERLSRAARRAPTASGRRSRRARSPRAARPGAGAARPGRLRAATRSHASSSARRRSAPVRLSSGSARRRSLAADEVDGAPVDERQEPRARPSRARRMYGRPRARRRGTPPGRRPRRAPRRAGSVARARRRRGRSGRRARRARARRRAATSASSASSESCARLRAHGARPGPRSPTTEMAIALTAADTSGRFRPEEDRQRRRRRSAGPLERDRDRRRLRDPLREQDRLQPLPPRKSPAGVAALAADHPGLVGLAARAPASSQTTSAASPFGATTSDPSAPISGLAVASVGERRSSHGRCARSGRASSKRVAQRPRPIARRGEPRRRPRAPRPSCAAAADDGALARSARAPSRMRSRSSRRRRGPSAAYARAATGSRSAASSSRAALAVREVPLEALALVVVERVERVAAIVRAHLGRFAWRHRFS